MAGLFFVVPVTVIESDPGYSYGETRILDATRRYGMGFASLSVGGLVKLGQNDGLSLRAAAITTFPSPGFVLQPSAGYAYGW